MSEARAVPSTVQKLLEACPFLADHEGISWDEGSTYIFEDVANLTGAGSLPPDEIDHVFRFFNELAQSGTDEELSVLAVSALENFNMTREGQILARSKLVGPARVALEEMRIFWGLPDYENGHALAAVINLLRRLGLRGPSIKRVVRSMPDRVIYANSRGYS